MMYDGSPTRKLVAVAPPRSPVIKIAPRTEVFGTTYTIQESSSSTPMVTIWLSGYPYRGIPSTTGAALISFIVALKSINSTGKALMTRPIHSIFFDAGTAEAADSAIDELCVTELMNFLHAKFAVPTEDQDTQLPASVRSKGQAARSAACSQLSIQGMPN